MTQGGVYFGGKVVAVSGLLAGLGIALGVPAIVLGMGSGLGAVVQTILVMVGIIGGVMVAGIAAFFGAVIPSAVSGSVPDELLARNRRAKVTATTEDAPQNTSSDAKPGQDAKV
jgi:hypothetical protein